MDVPRKSRIIEASDRFYLLIFISFCYFHFIYDIFSVSTRFTIFRSPVGEYLLRLSYLYYSYHLFI